MTNKHTDQINTSLSVKNKSCVCCILFFVACLLFLFGCSFKTSEEFLTRHHIEPPLIDDLHVCVSYACRHTSKTYLDPDEWNAVVLKMTPQDRDSPWLERRRIENTIGLLERIVGPKVGTQHNRARNRCGPSGTRQLDCIAEAVNTTIYLTLLEDNNLIRHHRVAKPERRGPLSGTWWHYAAAIIEIESDKLFAVDSWFYDNGHPATIISMEQWRQGGTPQ